MFTILSWPQISLSTELLAFLAILVVLVVAVAGMIRWYYSLKRPKKFFLVVQVVLAVAPLCVLVAAYIMVLYY